MRIAILTCLLATLTALAGGAQADPATERALELNQAPLSTASVAEDATTEDASLETRDDWGGSEAMAQARLRLNAQPQATQIVASDDATELAREATSG